MSTENKPYRTKDEQEFIDNTIKYLERKKQKEAAAQ